MKYFLDTYAIIEIIKKNKNYNKYEEEEIITSILNVGELYYSLLKEKGEKIADFWHESLKQTAIVPDIETVRKAMKFRFENKAKNFSFIDCVGYILAKERSLRFLTGDKAFEGFENVEFVK